MMEKNNASIYKLMLLGATIIWGSSFVIVKNTVDTIPPYALLAVRFTIATAMLGFVCIDRFKGFTLNMFLKSVAVGVFMYLGFALQTVGVQFTTPGKNAFLTGVYCVLVPFICRFTDNTRPDKFNYIAGILCLAGIGLVSVTGSFEIGVGDLLSLCCGVAFAVSIVMVAKYGKECDIMLLTFTEFLTMAVLAWISTAAAGEHIFTEVPWTTPALASIFTLALFSSCIATVLQNVGQQHTDASSAALILSLEAVFGVIFSVIFYKEEVTFKTAIGFVLIFAAIVISETKLSFLKTQKNISETDDNL